MNKQQRKEIDELIKRCESLKEKFAALEPDITDAFEEAGEIKADIEQIRDDEQEKLDNMPEGLQNGEKGEAIQSAISALEEAMSKLEEFETVGEAFNDRPDVDDVISNLSDATNT